MAKIYPNAPCPCGSGKKYKQCCGASLAKTDLRLEDFVLEKLSEDIAFVENVLQLIIGPWGYTYCTNHTEKIEQEYQKDGLKSFVKLDHMGIRKATKNSYNEKIQDIRNVRPYGGGIPDIEEDIMSLQKKGYICSEGRQVEIFHAYLLDNLSRRFKDYLYVPTKQAQKGQVFGAFARRGYDFLLGLTLYLELQLGVHIYLNFRNAGKVSEKFSEKCRDICIKTYALENMPGKDKINIGMSLFLLQYAELLGQIIKQYNAEEEVELYHSIGAYTEKQYAESKAMIQPEFYKPYPLAYHYPNYLFYLVSATCFQREDLYITATCSFPQCDFIKYMIGLKSITELFEEKVGDMEYDPADSFNVDRLKEWREAHGIRTKEKHIITRKETYDTAVFWFMDELNGIVNHMKSPNLEYRDFAEINEDDYTLTDGKRDINPARKSTSVNPVRKLRMEIYQALNGKCFNLYVGKEPGDTDLDYRILAGSYPILPWLSSGKEPTVHCRPFDRTERPDEDLYSLDVKTRQDYLTLEYRLTSIPVNCIEEYLNPDIFYNWEQKNELLKETRRQNEELKIEKDKVERQNKLNLELVRSITHSSANYLNSDKLAQTGIELHNAEKDNPSVDKLHLEGLSLILQSEQEMFLSRQLKGLVIKCSGDGDLLAKQIRSSLSKDEGIGVVVPVEFAIKTVVARVLFRDNDRRSEFIRLKMNKTAEEWSNIQSSFMLDILAANDTAEEGLVLKWWERYITGISVSFSNIWEGIKLIKDQTVYDLITEIVTEQILNALSHGKIEEGIKIEFGQADEFKGRPRWAYIMCRNTIGKRYEGGRGVGITTLNETFLLLNSNKKGIDITEEEYRFESKAWLLSSLLKAQ